MTNFKEQLSWWWDTVQTILFGVLIAVGIRTFAYEPFNIPSESMLPTLKVGDYVFVSKYAYGYSRHSLPFSLPLIPGRVGWGEVERGDVIVFKLPSDDKIDYIKRAIGLPGDRIQVVNGVLHINGEPVKRERIDDFVYRNPYGDIARHAQYRETLPNGVSYATLDLNPRGPGDNTPVYTVPEGHYFMMGDNRDNSSDSRFGVGFVPEVNLVGRANIRFFSLEYYNIGDWSIRWERLFTWVD